MKIICPCCSHEFVRIEDYGINESMDTVNEVVKIASEFLKNMKGEYIKASIISHYIKSNMKNKVSERNIPRILKKHGFIFEAETKYVKGKAFRMYQVK